MDVDSVFIKVQAGNGGKGADSYYRRTDRKVIPHGGDGGNGGSVIFRAEANAPLLKSLKYRGKLLAESGGNGGSNKKRGRNGESLKVLIPLGCKIYDRDNNFLIREFTYAGEEVIVAQGGKGGSGNQGGRPASSGEHGVVLNIEITQRVQADVFLVGLPDAGKSKLMHRLTHAKMTSEDHPFSTTSPQLGAYKISDYEQLMLCELPSIYGHSHEGRGLGVDFLKHLEAARFVAYVIDVNSKFASSLKEGYEILTDQINRYNPDFLGIRSCVIVNKIDLSAESVAKLKRSLKLKVPVFFISALQGDGIAELMEHLSKQVQQKDRS